MRDEQIHIPSTWTAEQAKTLLELVEALAEAIWHAHGDAIMRRHEELHGPPRPPDHPDDDPDDIPF